jgi:hypothetical protein
MPTSLLALPRGPAPGPASRAAIIICWGLSMCTFTLPGPILRQYCVLSPLSAPSLFLPHSTVGPRGPPIPGLLVPCSPCRPPPSSLKSLACSIRQLLGEITNLSSDAFLNFLSSGVAANCGLTEELLRCSRCRKEWFCSVTCQKAQWPFHRDICKKNEFADALEATEPQLAAWMRQHGTVHQA